MIRFWPGKSLELHIKIGKFLLVFMGSRTRTKTSFPTLFPNFHAIHSCIGNHSSGGDKLNVCKKWSRTRCQISRVFFSIGHPGEDKATMWWRPFGRVLNFGLVMWQALWAPEPSPVIQTTLGPVQGGVRYSRDNQKYLQFLGLPYAKPPVGDLAFARPEPPEPWTEIRPANKYGSMCAQFDLARLRSLGSLDCLFLNVFVHVAKEGYEKASKPVLFWLHGGAFITGEAGQYHPDFIMDQNVIVVTINYRLGPYGFLNLEEGSGPRGNMALFDSILALEWVQKNIRAFGGDPDRVTIIGESAGAIMSSFLVLSPLTYNLFSRAILQSGTATAPFSFSPHPRKIAEGYARKLGCPLDSPDDLLKCYVNTPWDKLVAKQHTLLLPLIEKDLFEPTIDGELVTERPQDTIMKGTFPPRPLLIGVNSGEGTIRSARFHAMPELIPELEHDWVNLATNLAVLEYPLNNETAYKIRREYFGNITFTREIAHLFKGRLTELVSDAGFFYPAHQTGVGHARQGAEVFMYFFNYTSNIFPGIYSGFGRVRLDDRWPSEVGAAVATVRDWVREYLYGQEGTRPYGINHGDDIPQLFNLEGLTKFIAFPDAPFSRNFVKAIVDFAAGESPLHFGSVEWPSINRHLEEGRSEDTIPFMLMDKPSKVVTEPFAENIKFWRELGQDEWNYR